MERTVPTSGSVSARSTREVSQANRSKVMSLTGAHRKGSTQWRLKPVDTARLPVVATGRHGAPCCYEVNLNPYPPRRDTIRACLAGRSMALNAIAVHTADWYRGAWPAHRW